MPLPKMFRWLRTGKQQPHRNPPRAMPRLMSLERREVPAGYVASGAGPGGLPGVSIRVDIQDAIGGSAPSPLGGPAAPRSDGKTETISQQFFPFNTGFRGGVHVATGNFDGAYQTPDSLVTAAGPGGGPHIIVWNMIQDASGRIVTNGIRDQFFAYDARFRGGVTVACGDLDGDGRAELITGAGPGGGPHVRVWKEVNGHFTMVNEFFAFDASFRGGVNLASGQGYRTVEQRRLTLSSQLPDNFAVTPYDDIPTQQPGLGAQIPLIGFDVPLAPGSSAGFGPGAGYTLPTGIVGHLDNNNAPLPYITVAGGSIQYNSGNLLNQFGDIVYRPNIYVPPQFTNEAGIGDIVFASWTATDDTFPGAPFLPDVVYGPFVRLTPAFNGTEMVERITRLTQAPNAVTFRNQLVIGAGPGGGPHVRVYDFAGTANGALINNGVGKEFFAFDASFRGGVNVAINDVIANPAWYSYGNATVTPREPNPNIPPRTPGRLDYTVPMSTPIPFIVDSNANSGSQVFLEAPFDTDLYSRYNSEIVTAMASGGGEVRVFGDFNPPVADTANPLSDAAPARRTTLSQVNLQTYNVDLPQATVPTAPLGGYSGFSFTGSFVRGIDNQFRGGVNVAVASLNFLGNSETRFYGFGPAGGGAPLATNPVLGTVVFGAGVTPPDQANRGSRVRIFDQLSPIPAYLNDFGPRDDFQAFPADSNAQGASVAFGYGRLPEPSLSASYINYAAGASGAIPTNTTIAPGTFGPAANLDLYMPPTSTSPILVTL